MHAIAKGIAGNLTYSPLSMPSGKPWHMVNT